MSGGAQGGAQGGSECRRRRPPWPRSGDRMAAVAAQDLIDSVCPLIVDDQVREFGAGLADAVIPDAGAGVLIPDGAR